MKSYFKEIIPTDTITIERGGEPAKYVFVYMLKDLNNLCGSCITLFTYAVIATIGYKVGTYIWEEKIEAKLK